MYLFADTAETVIRLSVSEVIGIIALAVSVIGGLMAWMHRISSQNTEIKTESITTTTQVADLKQDFIEVKSDIEEIKNSMSELRSDARNQARITDWVSKLSEGYLELRDRVARLEEFKRYMEGK